MLVLADVCVLALLAFYTALCAVGLVRLWLPQEAPRALPPQPPHPPLLAAQRPRQRRWVQIFPLLPLSGCAMQDVAAVYGADRVGGVVLLLTFWAYWVLDGRRSPRLVPAVGSLLLGCVLLATGHRWHAVGAFGAAIVGVVLAKVVRS